MAAPVQSHTCVIVGGGPAGMMLGYLFARAGIDVLVLEKHADFFRDFRGDTVHPSTLEVMHELGLLEDFLKRPHQKVERLRGWVGATELTVGDFSRLPAHCHFIAFMPQWDFLNFLVEKAKAFPSFHLQMEAEVTDLLEENGRVTGVRAKTPAGTVDIAATLVVGADGRHSVVREKAGLKGDESGVPIDVLWMHISRQPTDPAQTFGRFDRGKVLAMLNRESYWQLGYVIPKGALEEIKRQGLEALRKGLAEVAPFLSNRVGELKDWADIKLLTVLVNCLREWHRPGLLCIGDAAHAMSPVGGVGINLAVQDAVATANVLTRPLKEGTLTVSDLKKVQRRRALPTRLTQRVQLLIQKFIIGTTLNTSGFKTLPWGLQILQRFPILAHIPGRLVGMGFRPEHIQK